MKKIVIATLLVAGSLMAEVVSITPYVGGIKYDTDINKTFKDSATFGGLYSSVGNLSYLLEFSYNYVKIKYKDSLAVDDLVQHDLTMRYGKYYTNFMYKVGLHYINNNEKDNFRDLGSGYVAILGVAGYNWFSYDKLTYGLDAFYSAYLNAHDDSSLNSTKNVDIVQFTPYVAYSKAININMRNDFSATAYIINASDYRDSSYISYEFSNTCVYKSFYTTLKYLTGDMKSGVKDGGMTVFNTKDLFTSSYSAKVAYYFTPALEADLTYSVNKYQEYDAINLLQLPESSNKIAVLSMSYSF